MTPIRRLLPLSLVLLATLAPLASASDLRVVTRFSGTPLDLSGVEGREKFLAGPERSPAPAGAIWTLEGDLRANASVVRWSPLYFITRADERKLLVAPEKPWRAEVQVRHVPIKEVKPSRELAPLLFDWPEGLPDGGVAVVAWVLDGQAVETVLLPLPSTAREGSFGYAAEFRLTADQASRGQPALLVWRDGSFVAPAPVFPDGPGTEAFFAVRFDDVPALEKALAGGVKAEAASRDGLSLVHYAAETGAHRCLALLTQRQPKLAGQPDAHGWTPIHHASLQGRVEVVQSLLAAKAPADPKSKGVISPLILSAQHGHTSVVTALLDKRGAASAANVSPGPLEVAIKSGYADIAKVLVDAKLRYDAKAQSAGRDLLFSAMQGHQTMVTWLVAHGVDPNFDIRGATALTIAAKDGDASSARTLLEAGAHVEKASKEGFTPLMAAAQFGNLEYARALLEAGADVRASSSGGVTALHLAAIANNQTLVQLLIERGASTDARTKDDLSPLEMALSTGSAGAARVLATHGATINLANPNAERLLAAAVSNDLVEPIQSALREGWPADSTFAGVWPAVRLAEACKSTRCVEALLAAGARPPDLKQPMPITVARELDEPVRLARQYPVVDPRGNDEEYPEMVVRVSLLIDSEGRPLFPRISESPDMRLGQSVMESVANWRFNGLRRKGEPVAVRVVVPVSFPASTNRTFELSRVSQVPQPIKQEPPQYPAALKRNNVTGRVELGFVVDTNGVPRDIFVMRATHPEFAAAAVAALSTWVFKPGMIDGRPVNTRMRQPLSFTLNQ